MVSRTRARRGLAIFLASVIVVSAPILYLLLRSGRPIGESQLLVVALMWVPTVASIVARALCREGLDDLGLRLGARAATRWLPIAWLGPVAVGAIAYGIAWASGLARYAMPEELPLGLVIEGGDALRFAANLGLALTFGALANTIGTLGEELGFRSYLLPRLIDAGLPRPVLLSGLIWALWHAPLILSGQYAAGPLPWLAVLLFCVSATAMAYALATLRLASGSVWPAVLLHSSWNAVIMGAFDYASEAGSATLWIGESGILVALVAILLSAAIAKTRVHVDGGEPRVLEL